MIDDKDKRIIMLEESLKLANEHFEHIAFDNARLKSCIETVWREVRGGVPDMSADSRHVAALQRIHAAVLPVLYPYGNCNTEES